MGSGSARWNTHKDQGLKTGWGHGREEANGEEQEGAEEEGAEEEERMRREGWTGGGREGVEAGKEGEGGRERLSDTLSSELTGFFPRIYRIFPSSTSKRYS